MKSPPQPVLVDRRGALIGGGLAVAAALRPKEAEAFHAKAEEKAGRYKDSPHVQRFYALNRR
jgi:hypothetical protein